MEIGVDEFKRGVETIGAGVEPPLPERHGFVGIRLVGPFIASTTVLVKIKGTPPELIPLKSSVSIDQVRAPPKPIAAMY